MCSILEVYLKVFDLAHPTRCLLTKGLGCCINHINRFHFAVALYSDNAQRTSKRGKNINHENPLPLVANFVVLSSFDVNCALSEYRRTLELNIYFLKKGFSW